MLDAGADRNFTPVTISSVDRNVLARGSQEKVVDNITRKDAEERPDLIVLTPTCTSSILQEDLQNFVERASIEAKGMSYWRTLTTTVLMNCKPPMPLSGKSSSSTLRKLAKGDIPEGKTEKPSVNIIGISSLGFHHHHDCTELKRLMADLGIEVNQVIPEGASVHNLKKPPRAWFNLVPYRELGLMTARYLEQEFGMPYVDITPMGVVETARCVRKIQQVINEQGAGVDYEDYIENQTLHRFTSGVVLPLD
jgi:light-independent protochlorophyllide reductase subunit B